MRAGHGRRGREADTDSKTPRFLEWAREIEALAQTEHHYAYDDFQRERCRRLTAIAAEMISEHTGIASAALAMAFDSQFGYATPKIDVRAAVFRERDLLLVRERSDGGWTMPGGWVDVGDTPSGAAEREAWEEAGFRVKARRIVGVYDANRFPQFDVFHAFKIVFLCDLIDGEARISSETSEVAFFGWDRIPGTFSGTRTAARHIQDAFVALDDPARPSVFD
jgi:ADP-ribose pyrophosphatase YjhB (NUDIX family)